MADSGEVVKKFFEAYARATALPDVAFLESAYAEQFMFAGPNGAQAIKREDFLKVAPRRKEFLKAFGLKSSEFGRLEHTELDERYVQVKAYLSFVYEKEPGRRVVDAGAATYVLRRQGEQLQIVFQLDHQDLTKRAQEIT